MQPGTWLKWELFGVGSRWPVYLFFVGEVRDGNEDCYSFTLTSGTAFRANARFLSRWISVTEAEAIPRLSDRRNVQVEPTRHHNGLERRLAMAAGENEIVTAAKPFYSRRFVP